MDRKPAARGRPGEGLGDADAGEPREGPAPRGDVERFGPLQVTRLRKDDGRSLLVFAREPEER